MDNYRRKRGRAYRKRRRRRAIITRFVVILTLIILIIVLIYGAFFVINKVIRSSGSSGKNQVQTVTLINLDKPNNGAVQQSSTQQKTTDKGSAIEEITKASDTRLNTPGGN